MQNRITFTCKQTLEWGGGGYWRMYSLGEHLVRVDIAGHGNDLDCDVVRGYKLTFDLLSIDDCYS